MSVTIRKTKEAATTIHPITPPNIAPTGEGLPCVSVVVIIGGLVSQEGGTKGSACSSTYVVVGRWREGFQNYSL